VAKQPKPIAWELIMAKPTAKGSRAVELSLNGMRKKAMPKKTQGNGNVKKVAKPAGKLELPKDTLLQMFDLMVKARVLEERLIKVYKTGDAFFWIGGAGEEAFGVPLGMLTLKGQGPQYDYLHMHYRATPTMIALGMPMIDSLRLMMNRATDPSTGGRNFCNHYCFPQWNVVPVTSPIEVQYSQAIGTGIVQRRWRQEKGSKSISIITGGDAGTAEGDFASALIWSSRPGSELPMLMTVQNNRIGISTTYETQHGEKQIADRGKAFGIRTAVINGNDPIESYLSLKTEMEYIRKTGKPVLMEVNVSRLYGHSSATGANREAGDCCIDLFEEKLLRYGVIGKNDKKLIWDRYETESRNAAEQVRSEPVPTSETIWDNVYADGENADWRKF
jgi:2-oxoisovalerate dehydrogenase E1 component alpha subunit